MSEPFLGQISLFSFNYPPRGWAMCVGTTIYIPQQAALYTLIGTQFGGDGRQTFMLPDLRGRAMVGSGQIPGVGQVVWENGTTGGLEGVALTLGQYPSHTHMIDHLNLTATVGTPTASPAVAFGNYHPPVTAGILVSSANVHFIDSAVSTVGGVPSHAHENRQPLLAMNPCISLEGDYPPFNN